MTGTQEGAVAHATAMGTASPALPLFVYGTLQDNDVMKRVTALDLVTLDARPAVLAGQAVERAEGFTYPLLVERAGASAGGLVLAPPGETAMKKLIAYETAAYALKSVTVLCDKNPVTCLVFVPRGEALRSSGEAWNLADWQRLHKQQFLGRLVAAAPF